MLLHQCGAFFRRESIEDRDAVGPIECGERVERWERSFVLFGPVAYVLRRPIA
jgi:hypothetical protein